MTETQQMAALRDRIDGCVARSGLYRLLGRCLLDEVDGDFLDLLRGPLAPMLKVPEVGFDEGHELFTAPAEALIDALSREFNSLLVVPGAVSPYRSVFETGAIFQSAADEAAAAYREGGFVFESRHSGEFPDHLGVMLTFAAGLCDREAEAVERCDLEVADRIREQREAFMLEQIGPWGPGWCHRAHVLADHDFYARLLDFTERLLWQELNELADRKQMKKFVALNRRKPVVLDYDADFRKASGL